VVPTPGADPRKMRRFPLAISTVCQFMDGEDPERGVRPEIPPQFNQGSNSGAGHSEPSRSRRHTTLAFRDTRRQSRVGLAASCTREGHPKATCRGLKLSAMVEN
jgi:hypothetical protein